MYPYVCFLHRIYQHGAQWTVCTQRSVHFRLLDIGTNFDDIGAVRGQIWVLNAVIRHHHARVFVVESELLHTDRQRIWFEG